jgi:hypothetical protein
VSRLGLAVALLAAVPAFPAAAQEPSAESVAFVEWALPRDQAWRGETLRVGVRFGLQEQFQAERLVQPFRRTLDVPVRLLLPGLELDGCLAAVPASPGAGVEFALAEEVARARELPPVERGGERFRVFEYALDLHPTCVGDLALPAPQLVLTTAASFSVDVFGNRTPLEPLELVRDGAPAVLRVLALPEEGRPEHFSGGVGTFTLAAAVREPRVAPGEGLLLELTLEGRGDLAAVEPPRLDALPGLRVRGLLEHSQAGRRTWTYELVPASERVRAVPPVELVVFDPELGTWRTLSTAAVPIEVLPQEPGPTTAPAAGDAPAPRRRGAWWIALPAAVLLGWWWQARRRAREAPSPAAERAQAARAALAAAEGDALARYTAFLAVFLARPAPAVVGARLAERLGEAGAPADLALRLARHHDELTDVRYGGRDAGPDGEAEVLADELVAALR